ncbi:RNA-binding protein [Yaniella sp.]|uniref:RNA-binding protein n=1 Tax=Yaniella sp. TaxID=2773929 RepID=UPI00264971C2|nr:RNA-binding protein [Yaniella sp.]MDN5816476.1 RNA-binding protein [Yaniella sp.]
MTMLQEALEHLVRGIVDYPEDVQVDLRNNRRGEMLSVHVNPDDLGRVIGRKGRTANSLRAVVEGLAGYSVRVDVVDTDRNR